MTVQQYTSIFCCVTMMLHQKNMIMQEYKVTSAKHDNAMTMQDYKVASAKHDHAMTMQDYMKVGDERRMVDAATRKNLLNMRYLYYYK